MGSTAVRFPPSKLSVENDVTYQTAWLMYEQIRSMLGEIVPLGEKVAEWKLAKCTRGDDAKRVEARRLGERLGNGTRPPWWGWRRAKTGYAIRDVGRHYLRSYLDDCVPK
jgi:hypothetical protein